YLPEENIILNIGSFTYKYKDADGSVKKFENEQKLNRYNFIWDKLNAYFQHCLPNCKIINLKDTTYIGQYNHPFGKAASHYQSGYYKEFMNRLNKLVMRDIQKERHLTGV
ncbi:MAG: hypothetical protein AB2401_06510, partial [Bacillus sp. (in: firmicutes)]